MLHAGIDEAGYGPLLGPLCLGLSVFQLPDSQPDAWKCLRSAVSATRDKSGRKLHVADSKKVYSPSIGLKELERSVLAFAHAADVPTTSLSDLLTAVDPHSPPHLARHPWYAASDEEPWPVELSPASLIPTANALRACCQSASVRILRLGARIIPEGRYNDLVSATRNKSSASFSQLASLLNDAFLLAEENNQDITIVCDRQGGREHYIDPLRTMFPDHHLSVVEELPACARYELSLKGRTAHLSFQEKGESVSLATALASMIAKYTREALMHRFNRWWATHNPALKPTAGYYTDGLRFLEDTADLRTRLNIQDRNLIRER
jgi:ribonuclease HII